MSNESFRVTSRVLVSGLVGGAIGGLLAFATINYLSTTSAVGATDAVAIANTYIVYTTFVIAAVALLLTIAGLMFTQHFAIEKEAHIANAFSSLIEEMRTNDEKAVRVVQNAMENPRVVEYVSEALRDKIKQEIQARKSTVGQKAKDAKLDSEALDSFAKDLDA